MDLRPQLQAIKAENNEKIRNEDQAERRKDRHYHHTLVNLIVNAIENKRICNGNYITVYMRMDRKRRFWVEEINLLLRDHYVRINRISVCSTEFNSCIVNPCCIFCFPCISLPKIAMNALFGTQYEVNVSLDM